MMQHDIPGMLWETVGADIFMLKNKAYFCIADHQSKFLGAKIMDILSADSLIKTCIIILPEYALLRKISSDAGANFVSEQIQEYCSYLNIKEMDKQKHE